MVKTYCFDLDNTLCKTDGVDYEKSTPIHSRIRLVNELFDAGNTIYVHTARGFITQRNLEDFTMEQLRHWGLKYHKLFMGKPAADFYIDDKAVVDSHFFGTLA